MEREQTPVSISVIMSVASRPQRDDLYAAVRSILGQSVEDFEFLIYHDGSDKGTNAMLRKLARTDPRIRLLGGKAHNGLGYALNACIREARGTYLARMDADDIALPERFAVQLEYMEGHPDVPFCGCGAYLFDEQGIWGSRCMPERPRARDYLKYSPFIHPTVMYRRSVFDGLRGGAEGYPESDDTLLCEDYELFMQLHQKGVRGSNLTQPLLLYRENSDTYRKRKFIIRLNASRLRFRNFKAMRLLWPFGWVQALRPVMASLLPSGWIARIKRTESGDRSVENTQAAELLQSYLEGHAA